MATPHPKPTPEQVRALLNGPGLGKLLSSPAAAQRAQLAARAEPTTGRVADDHG